MADKYFALELVGGIGLSKTHQNCEGVTTVYIYTAEEHAEVEKLRALYRAINPVIDYAGAHGSILARGDRMQAVMDVIYALDGGTYSKKVAGEESALKQAKDQKCLD